jgi:hypothetical protein
MNFRSIAKALRYGTDHQTPIASGDLVTGTVVAAQLAAAPVVSSTGALTLQTGVTPREMGGHPIHQTVLQLTNQVITITDALAYAGLQLYTFPTGWITVLGCAMKFTATTTSDVATTLNASKAVQYGLGTATASATTLATTMIDTAPGTGVSVPTFTSSATTSTVNTAVTAGLTLAGVPFDGTTTARKLFFNVAIGTGTDIDADATVALNGTIAFTWINGGAYGLTYTP